MYHTFEMQIYLHFKSVIYINIYLVRQMIQMITVLGEGWHVVDDDGADDDDDDCDDDGR